MCMGWAECHLECFSQELPFKFLETCLLSRTYIFLTAQKAQGAAIQLRDNHCTWHCMYDMDIKLRSLGLSRENFLSVLFTQALHTIISKTQTFVNSWVLLKSEVGGLKHIIFYFVSMVIQCYCTCCKTKNTVCGFLLMVGYFLSQIFAS